MRREPPASLSMGSGDYFAAGLSTPTGLLFLREGRWLSFFRHYLLDPFYFFSLFFFEEKDMKEGDFFKAMNVLQYVPEEAYVKS